MSKHPTTMNSGAEPSKNQNNAAAANEKQPLIRKPPKRQDSPGWDACSDESEIERRYACQGMCIIALTLFLILITLRYASSWFFHTENFPSAKPPTPPGVDNGCPEHIPFCHHDETIVHVVKPGQQKGFPSFWDYATHGAIDVTYDGRSFLLNQERALFLSGSMHPIRATKQTWENSLDLVVQNGLNMIAIYVFWAEHQPLPGQAIDWTLPGGRGVDCQGLKMDKPSYCGWSLADAIRAAAQRGLFVHARIGPYVCAEYNYGGIPEWVALNKSNMQMRRLEPQWLEAMEGYVTAVVSYLAENKLFAYQGGPIIAGQIENELGESNDDDSDIPIAADVHGQRRGLQAEEEGEEVPGKPTVQAYADWCGALVERLAPNVTWTMCNGLNANNTIVTCNGDCSTKWLEQHGSSGRIQVDQPAIFSEDEGGFQIWGDEASKPSDYFWGRTARAMAYDALRWFARGGTHLNYYMFWGAYNRGRASAGGIMNGYATDAAVCSSGEPRQPKFGHFQALHHALQQVASILLEARTAVNKDIEVERLNDKGEWEKNGKQRMFLYRTNYTREENHEVLIVENNDSKGSVTVKLMLGVLKKATLIVEMNPRSALLIKDGAILFDSFEVNPADMSHARKIDPDPIGIQGWTSCLEPIGTGTSSAQSTTIEGTMPVEQTFLNIDAGVSSDYAWYETQLHLSGSLEDASIFVESQKASALTLYIDEVFQGEAFNHQHKEGNETYQFLVGSLDEGLHTLAILSESLGYNNLIGRWSAKATAEEKVKGITGDVVLESANGNQSLVGNGLVWKSSPGLNGEEDGTCRNMVVTQGATRGAQWSTGTFSTPRYDPTTHALFLNVTRGRGHLWLNGHDLGRFWDIKRGNTSKLSQQFYFLPFDYLDANGGSNKLVLFDALGNDMTSTKLILSWLEKTDSPNFNDEVDYQDACI